ncbi:MAG TPA: membrane-bound lytic murein transglycosylase MltF [Acidiferrobacteraceae bacterium]|nr:membrane-bound lytic murein transglycosylase MltF [Acidiferrobacteraceae bacterium]
MRLLPKYIHANREMLEWLWLGLLSLTLLLLPATLMQLNRLDTVKASGTLRVLTLNGPTSFYSGPDGNVGFEYDLAGAFANSLGVQLEMVVVENFKDMLPRIASGEGDFAAAGITITEQRKSLVRFSPPYQEIRQQVVYRRGTEKPYNIKELAKHHPTIVAGTSFSERLNELKKRHPKLEWTEVDDQGPEDLLIEVWEGLQEATIADSNLVAVVQQFYPELSVAFNIQRPEQLAWAFPLSDDHSLYNAAAKFIKEAQSSGALSRIIDRYYGPASRSTYPNLAAYQRRIESILPEYQSMFEKVGAEHDLDWRLLAAQAYQESLWNPEAVSPTGVRGIMMLTNRTARFLNVKDRVDPYESISGGTLYLRDLIDRVPATVEEPDRTWMALAAYNVGMGHLEDARVITAKQGGNPNIWKDVRERLPLLAKPAWYRKTRHGYARGYEPVQYVRRIRTYYDILVKVDEDIKATTSTEAIKVEPSAL